MSISREQNVPTKLAPINPTAPVTFTPEEEFFLAAEVDPKKLQELLKNEKVDINKSYNKWNSTTALHRIAMRGHSESLNWLLKDPRININVLDGDKSSPFAWACLHNRVEVVKAFIYEPKLNVNFRNKEGHSPLYLACHQGNTDVVRWLMACGRKLDLSPSNGGDSPIVIAQKKNHTELAKELIAYQQDPSSFAKEIRKKLNLQPSTLENELGLFLSVCAYSDPPEAPLSGILHLSLADSHLKAIPEKLATMSMNLTTLDLSQNLIETIPSFFSRFKNLTNLDLSGNPLQNSADAIADIMKNCSILKNLNLSRIPFTPSSQLKIIEAMLWNLSHEQTQLREFLIDDTQLTSYQGLDMIPENVKSAGGSTKKIIDYLLGIYQSPGGRERNQRKILVLGPSKSGKTTFINCLFPLQGWILSKGDLKKTKYFFILSGHTLRKFKEQPANEFNVQCHREYRLNNTWVVNPKGDQVLTIEPPKGETHADGKKVKTIQLYLDDLQSEAAWQEWQERLYQAILEKKTLSLDVRTSEKKAQPPLAIWDFPGDLMKFELHRYFLTPNSSYVVTFDLSDFKKFKSELEPWFQALSSQINLDAEAGNLSTSSIFVVGTHLDLLNAQPVGEPERRKEMVTNLAKECGIPVIYYYEVSCATLANLAEVKEIILRITEGHTVERFPRYIDSIDDFIREKKASNPVVRSSNFLAPLISDANLIRSALNKLSLYGSCIYLDRSPALEFSTVRPGSESAWDWLILNPADLSQSFSLLVGGKKSTSSVKDLADILEYLGICSESKETGLVFPLSQTTMISTSNSTSSTGSGSSVISIAAPQPLGFVQNFTEWPSACPAGLVEVKRRISFNPTFYAAGLFPRLFVKIQKLRPGKKTLFQDGIHLDSAGGKGLVSLFKLGTVQVYTRGKDRRECISLMQGIIHQIYELTYLSAGVTLTQCDVNISNNPEIKLAEHLVPFMSNNPESKQLFIGAGLVDDEATLSKTDLKWLNGLEPERKNLEYEPIKILEKGKVHHQGLADKFKLLVSKNILNSSNKTPKLATTNPSNHPLTSNEWTLNGIEIDEAYSVLNESLLSSFLNHLLLVIQQLRAIDMLYLKQEADPHKEKRLECFQIFQRRINLFLESAGLKKEESEGNLAIMIHGTTKDKAFKICESGFEETFITDRPFGRGFFFSGDFELFQRQSNTISSASSSACNYYIVTAIICGRSFPIVETAIPNNYRNKKEGHHSHYTLYKDLGGSTSPASSKEPIGDQLIVFDRYHCLPLFVFSTIQE